MIFPLQAPLQKYDPNTATEFDSRIGLNGPAGCYADGAGIPSVL